MQKRLIILLVLIFFSVFCIVSYLFDYPRNVTFVCSKQENTCTYSASNRFKPNVVKIIEFDKILKSQVEENVTEKLDDLSRHRYFGSRTTTYYYYDWVVVYYDNNGNLDKLNVFSTSDYENVPASGIFDKEYRYYIDVTKMFNSFLEDKSKFNIYIPEYSDNSAKEYDFWAEMFVLSFMLTMVLGFAYLLILIVLSGLEIILPEGKIKQIIRNIGEKLP